jgi:hypothetical protein
MSTKLSFLSRAAVVAGVLALGLPALAQTSQPAVAPSASPAVSPAPVMEKRVAKPASVDNKTAKDKTHAAKKPLVKTAKNTTTHKTVVPVAATKTEQPTKTDTAK